VAVVTYQQGEGDPSLAEGQHKNADHDTHVLCDLTLFTKQISMVIFRDLYLWELTGGDLWGIK
jgi:hypothetical protein